MFLLRNAPRNENAEVTNRLVNGVDNRLAAGADFVDVLIQIQNPPERLLGGCDVVAL